jgi:hypothetical protein
MIHSERHSGSDMGGCTELVTVQHCVRDETPTCCGQPEGTKAVMCFEMPLSGNSLLSGSTVPWVHTNLSCVHC